MSLNKFTSASYATPKPWMNLRVNTLSFGDGNGKVKTQAYGLQTTATLGTITTDHTSYYTCDHTSLRIRGYVDYTTAITPHNNFDLEIKLPPELVSRFGTGSAVISTGYLTEYPDNNNVNHALVSKSVINGTNDGVVLTYFWANGNVNTSFTTRIYLDCTLFKIG